MKYDNFAELEHLFQVSGCPVRGTREEVKRYQSLSCSHAHMQFSIHLSLINPTKLIEVCIIAAFNDKDDDNEI